MALGTEPKVPTFSPAMIQQADAIGSIFSKYAFAFCLIYGMAVFSGYLPFRPFDYFVSSAQYNDRLEKLVKEKADADRLLGSGLSSMARVLSRYERRERLIECTARFADQKTRDWCINDGIGAPPP